MAVNPHSGDEAGSMHDMFKVHERYKRYCGFDCPCCCELIDDLWIS